MNSACSKQYNNSLSVPYGLFRL